VVKVERPAFLMSWKGRFQPMRLNLIRLCLPALVLGLSGCGEPAPEVPSDYGEQHLTAKEQPGKKGVPPVPKGMESAESRTPNPLP
jgi:hypothetical protein